MALDFDRDGNIRVKVYSEDGEDWNTSCPVCDRPISAHERSDGIIEVEASFCPHFKEFDWYEDTFTFRPQGGD